MVSPGLGWAGLGWAGLGWAGLGHGLRSPLELRSCVCSPSNQAGTHINA